HDKCAFRQVEVGDEPVDGVQFHTRINENIRVAAARYDLAVSGPYGFQCAAAGGPHGDDPVTGGPCGVDEAGGFLAHGIPFAVHLVVLDVILTDRAEGA